MFSDNLEGAALRNRRSFLRLRSRMTHGVCGCNVFPSDFDSGTFCRLGKNCFCEKGGFIDYFMMCVHLHPASARFHSFPVFGDL